MKKKQVLVALGIGFVVFMLATVLALMPINGADDLAANAVLRITPGYEPWANHGYQPAVIVAALIMGLQAGIGMFVGVLLVMWYRNRKQHKAADANAAPPGN